MGAEGRRQAIVLLEGKVLSFVYQGKRERRGNKMSGLAQRARRTCERNEKDRKRALRSEEESC